MIRYENTADSSIDTKYDLRTMKMSDITDYIPY